MGGETMPQRVWTHLAVESRSPDVFLDQNPEHFTRQGSAAATDKDPGAIRNAPRQPGPKIRQIFSKRLDGRPAERHHPLLVPFPEAFAKSRIQVQVLQFHIGDLRSSAAGGI